MITGIRRVPSIGAFLIRESAATLISQLTAAFTGRVSGPSRGAMTMSWSALGQRPNRIRRWTY